MELSFNCPQCEGPLVAPEEARGSAMKCAHCAQQIIVPVKSVLETVTPNRPETIEAPTPKPETDARGGGRANDSAGAERELTSERLTGAEQTNRDLAHTLRLTHEELTAHIVQQHALQTECESLRDQLQKRVIEVADWRAYHEAVQNDIEQANILAADFRSQLAQKCNELGECKIRLEHLYLENSGQCSELAKLRNECERLRRCLEVARDEHHEVTREWRRERREAQQEANRLGEELLALRAKVKAIETSAVDTMAGIPPEMVTALRQLESALSVVQKATEANRAMERVEIVAA